MSEWISVKDRMPEEDQLVAFADIGYGEVYASACGKFFGGSFHVDTDGLEASNYDGSACVYLDFIPTHWVALPSIPKD